jgi:predicted GIY-YIG superfamily endonuclease
VERSEGVRKILNRLPKGPGVYMITHEPTDRIYVGFSKNLDKGVRHRVSQHFDDLTRGRHTGCLIQDVWNFDPNPEHWSAEILLETSDPRMERLYMEAFSLPNGHDFNVKRCLS